MNRVEMIPNLTPIRQFEPILAPVPSPVPDHDPQHASQDKHPHSRDENQDERRGVVKHRPHVIADRAPEFTRLSAE